MDKKMDEVGWVGRQELKNFLSIMSFLKLGIVCSVLSTLLVPSMGAEKM